ncbi:MAG: hypothetical protein JW838_08110 [Spirochaetes bacterium]|nr:hypothetical protein [Spirochaetota bacterium]
MRNIQRNFYPGITALDRCVPDEQGQEMAPFASPRLPSPASSNRGRILLENEEFRYKDEIMHNNKCIDFEIEFIGLESMAKAS